MQFSGTSFIYLFRCQLPWSCTNFPPEALAHLLTLLCDLARVFKSAFAALWKPRPPLPVLNSDSVLTTSSPLGRWTCSDWASLRPSKHTHTSRYDDATQVMSKTKQRSQENFRSSYSDDKLASPLSPRRQDHVTQDVKLFPVRVGLEVFKLSELRLCQRGGLTCALNGMHQAWFGVFQLSRISNREVKGSGGENRSSPAFPPQSSHCISMCVRVRERHPTVWFPCCIEDRQGVAKCNANTMQYKHLKKKKKCPSKQPAQFLVGKRAAMFVDILVSWKTPWCETSQTKWKDTVIKI